MKHRYECRLCEWTTPDFEYEEQDEVHECLEFMEYCENHLENEHPEICGDLNREPVMEYFPKRNVIEDDAAKPSTLHLPLNEGSGAHFFITSLTTISSAPRFDHLLISFSQNVN